MTGLPPCQDLLPETPPSNGIIEGSGKPDVNNLIFLLTIFNNMVGGFVYVKKKWYLCIVGLVITFDGRGTDVSWGVLREPAL